MRIFHLMFVRSGTVVPQTAHSHAGEIGNAMN